ncbi:acyl-CoA dehydrogenase family protein [Candidatus Poriferisocius sp.]|uniref:acyl-CoA dehydrogenase family protein n=1 Tax=Candidatus Poriferisocius sp. TaxID=3101276 RepID=UPI003B5AEE4B
MGAESPGRATGELLVEDMTDAERGRALRVDSVLGSLAERAEEADRTGQFPLEHVRTISDAGLLGLTVPVAYGGLGGGLRDLAAATFAMGTACASTALAYFFQCSGSSRGLLPLDAVDAGLFADDEVPVVRAFGEKVLRRMGAEGRWVANFASESVRSKSAAVTIATEATRTEGGWRLNGVKSFGCATGVADDYLVTAKLDTGNTAEHLVVFLVPRTTPGVADRTKWDAIGMRASATHGIVLDDAFVPDENALAVPGVFMKMTQVSRGSFVGNQVALSCVYLGAAQAVYDYALGFLTTTTYHDSDEPIGGSDVHRQLIGKMRAHLDTAYLWARRQIALESTDPPVIPKDDVVANWRIAKGEIADNCFNVAVHALKACGTGNTGMQGPISRALRDLSMGLVQGFPAERGRLEAAAYHVFGKEGEQFATAGPQGAQGRGR